MDNEKFKIDGFLNYVLGVDSLNEMAISVEDYYSEYKKYLTKDQFYELAEKKSSIDVYSLINGLEFLEDIKSGAITNYDGCISNVFVDRKISNLGLFTEDGVFIDGAFLLDESMWKKICSEHEVIVNWANK